MKGKAHARPELLITEKQQSIHEYDTAWDNTTRREEAEKVNAGKDRGNKN